MEFGGLKTNTDEKAGMFISPNNICCDMVCVYTNYLAVLKCYNMMLVYTQVYLYFCYEKYIFLKSTIIENEYKILYTNNLHKSNSECMTNNL